MVNYMKSETLLNWQKRALKREKKPERLYKIVDKVLKQIFGEPATLTIYKHLEEKYSLKREDIPNEPELFAEGLEKYLSDSGASVVLGMILDESSEMRLKNVGDRNFFEHLKELKKVPY